jgi:hypothetical protein
MNFHWARSNEFSLALLVTATAIVGVLTTQVMHQQHDQNTVDSQVLRAAPAASIPAGADIMATPHVASHPDRAVTSNAVNAAAASAPQVVPAPQVITTPVAPAIVAPAPSQLAPSLWTPLKRKTVPHQRVNSAPAPPPATAASPITPVIQIDTRAKPGSPDGW